MFHPSRQLDTWQRKSEVWRAAIGSPFLKWAKSCGLSANQVTVFRLFLAALFPLLILKTFTLALVLIAIAILLDAVDGPIARFSKTDTNQGKTIDILVDQLTFAFLALGFMRLWPDLALPLATAAGMILFLYVIALLKKPSVQLTIYKVIFIAIIIFAPRADLFLILSLVAAIHFIFHFADFVLRKN